MGLFKLSVFKLKGAFSRPPITVIGMVVMAGVVLVTYFPALGIGFWMDDLINVDTAGRFSGLVYLAKAFDPRLQRLWYRPMIVMEWKIEYILFGGDPVGYHFVQVLLHLVACLLLFMLAKRVTKSLRIGFVAALIYATLPLASMAVYWPSVHDPLTACFYLLTLWLWLDYLESYDRFKFLLTLVAFICALLSKEVSVTVLFLLVLADLLLVKKPAALVDLLRRYAVFLLVLAAYAPLELTVISQSVFTQQIGYGLGFQIVPTFFQYLSFLVFPWDLDQTIRYAFLAGAMLLVAVAALRVDRRVLFVLAAGALPTLIATPIPIHLFNPRYLYLPLMATAVGLALLVEVAIKAASSRRWVWAQAGLGLILAFGMVSESANIAELTVNHGGFIRELRLLFRPIYQRHPTFAPDTYLYFIDTPLQSLDISGLMFLHYGANVIISGADRAEISNLRDHNAAFIFYLDNQNVFQEQAVDQNSIAAITPTVPVQFERSISLQSFDIASARVKHGGAIVVLLLWKATGPIDKDYTVFAHLVDEQGKMIAGVDGQPRKGLAPTSSWRPNGLVADSVVIPITDEIPAGQKYRVEIGLYYHPTMERLGIVDAAGKTLTDHVTIAPISIDE